MKKNISYGKNVYNDEEIKAVSKTLKKSTQMGKSVDIFEKKISRLFGKKYGLMVNSGSSALILALKAMNFKKGSEIITPCLNFGTTVSSILLNNLVPVLVDINVKTLQVDTNIIEKCKFSAEGCSIKFISIEENIDVFLILQDFSPDEFDNTFITWEFFIYNIKDDEYLDSRFFTTTDMAVKYFLSKIKYML